MTKFINKDFNYDGMYLTYGPDRRFVARFKYGGMVAFKKFLRENFTVEEYFQLLESSLGPLKVLETKGYVSPVVTKQLKQRGYPTTQDGFKQMIRDDIARMKAKKVAA
tara:strand:+ start:112 stop:435 length:324 start_codon:yes stop_codon:yes gene_type:complete